LRWHAGGCCASKRPRLFLGAFRCSCRVITPLGPDQGWAAAGGLVKRGTAQVVGGSGQRIRKKAKDRASLSTTPTSAEPIFPALEALTARLTRPRPPLSRAPAQVFPPPMAYYFWQRESCIVWEAHARPYLRMRCLRLFRDHCRLVSINPFED
jgi:hypothetical protein